MKKAVHGLLLAGASLLLAGCNMEVLSPSGDIAAQQRDLLILSTVLMLLIIVPVMVATIWFAWKYRASNTKADYQPDWDHSTKLELMIWACPLVIIVWLGALTWVGTHLLDPYRPLGRIEAQTPIAENVEPLVVQVVALDWKWLFIYPQYGVAAVNELAAPVNRPINFQITSSSVMNAFYVPALAGMIYAMPGMETKLHAVINAAGSYKGFSANYSGDGFSDMKFTFNGVDDAGFEAWVAKARAGGQRLDRELYLTRLEVPTEKEPVAYYATVDEDLYPAILNMCVDPNKMCMGARMAIDKKGGLGMKGINLTSTLTYDKYTRRGSMTQADPDGRRKMAYVDAICAPGEQLTRSASFEAKIPDSAPLRGYGLAAPGRVAVKQPTETAVTTKTAAAIQAGENEVKSFTAMVSAMEGR